MKSPDQNLGNKFSSDRNLIGHTDDVTSIRAITRNIYTKEENTIILSSSLDKTIRVW